MKLNWSQLPRPIIALSPMADMTDSAFCRTVRSLRSSGPVGSSDPSSLSSLSNPSNHILFREMVSAEAVVRGNDKTLTMTEIHEEEHPLVQQLFGSDPSTMTEAVRIIEEHHHPEGFDVNMGCPVHKIVHNFNGAALMREPELASRIIKAMKAATRLPVSIKIRAGWDNPRECFEFSKVVENAGADLITMHGRTKTQGYSGQSDWNLIGEVKKGLSIPLLANGDIHTPPLTLKALETTGADGVLIARGALGNPWIFSQIEYLLARREPKAITLEERVRVVKQHLAYHIEQYGERGVVTFRKHLSWYFRGINGGKPYKERLHTATNKEEVDMALDEMLIHGLIDGLSTRDALHPQATERVFMKK
ncbi:tRNA dihydrouridine synthase DusB [Patescibacteria group bacterium]|nr:MAG: tRNA dihydrouridine synthase DusB [Patescibacteria group bacterium]